MSAAADGVTARLASDDALSLVVPCYNERHRLRIEDFREALAQYPWLALTFVNDGSTDGTAAMLDAFALHLPTRITVRHLPSNVGKAETVRQGLRLARSAAPIVGFCDADLSAPLSEIARLRNVLLERDRVEWVWGIRLLSLGRVIERRSTRHYLGRAFATMTSVMLGIRAYDTQCGCTILRSTVLLDAVLATPFRSRWIFDVEMLARAATLRRIETSEGLDGLVVEQPLQEWRHQPGSKVKPADFTRAMLELWAIRKEVRRRVRVEPA